jgi:hypothetical protein
LGIFDQAAATIIQFWALAVTTQLRCWLPAVTNLILPDPCGRYNARLVLILTAFPDKVMHRAKGLIASVPGNFRI